MLSLNALFLKLSFRGVSCFRRLSFILQKFVLSGFILNIFFLKSFRITGRVRKKITLPYFSAQSLLGNEPFNNTGGCFLGVKEQLSRKIKPVLLSSVTPFLLFPTLAMAEDQAVGGSQLAAQDAAVARFDTTQRVENLAASDSERALRILRKVDDLWRGSSSYAVFTMQVKTANYRRTLKLEGWSKGKELTLIKILSPKKEKGTATLKSKNHIYTYLPRTDRTIRLTSGMMMGSWMGSHFTNDDLVKESRREEDYNVQISFEGARNGIEVIEFTLIPKFDAAVVWGKATLTVRQKDYMPLNEIYFDEDMAVARTVVFENITLLAGRPRPAVMRVIPADKPEEFTQLTYEKLALDISLEEKFFSLARLKRK